MNHSAPETAGETPDLTLVIPCYCESGHIEKSVADLFAALDYVNLKFEVLFIDDKSPDDTVARIQGLIAKEPRAKLIQNEVNLGRGATVNKGIRMSAAKVVGFIDIDLSTPPIYIAHLAHLILKGNADVATCNRSYKIEMRIFHKVIVRYVLSYGYRALSRMVLGHPLKDTETGCKFFAREKILPILDKIDDAHWFWDTEVMVFAWLAGLRIFEEYSIFIRRPQKRSTVKVARDVKNYLVNMWRFKKLISKDVKNRRTVDHEAATHSVQG